MKAIITVGLGFGDEGKGATVDFLVRQLGAKLVVRYCGGAQAGHNVVTQAGHRHTFSQFGAGTLAGAETFLGPRMILNPGTMVPEAEHLQEIGVRDPWSTLWVHPSCLISTTYHMLMNRLRELARGAERHGSCGLGIGEARSYWLRYGQDAIQASELTDVALLTDKLRLLRDRCLIEMQSLVNLDRVLCQEFQAWLPADEARLLADVGHKLRLTDEMPKADTIIFEGAQGVLLDEWFGFHPYTTWSTVTPMHAWELLRESYEMDRDHVDVTVLGITRAYQTRHGVGPFPTYCKRLSKERQDQGNPQNAWQGAIRFGALDLVMLEYAAKIAQVDALFVNHMDEFGETGDVAVQYQDLAELPVPASLSEQEALTRNLERAVPILENVHSEELLQRLGRIKPIYGLGHGPQASDRKLILHRGNAA
jgi:adenylosuccinate synthase